MSIRVINSFQYFQLLRVGPNITEAFKLEPALQAILPPELGGTGKPEAQLIGKSMIKVTVQRIPGEINGKSQTL